MKYLAFMFFFGLSFTAFSANTLSEAPIKFLDNLEVNESKIETIEIENENSQENAVAFECYYTVEWLYIDSPFIKKLDALA